MEIFVTPQESLQTVIDNIQGPAKIILSPGRYYCKLKVNKPNITILGNSADNTFISYDDYALKIHKDGKEYNTFRTYTMCITADNVYLENLTIENTSGHGKTVGQAVALHAMGDKLFVKNCCLQANQDTLFTGPLPEDLIKRYEGFLPDDERLIFTQSRQYYQNCVIKGDIDFIFGSANAIFDKCDIISLDQGYVSAPSTPKEQEFGHTFIECNFLSQIQPDSVFLARPWRDYGKAVFINCKTGPHIKKEGFDYWQGTKRFETCRFYEYNTIPHSTMRASFCKQLSKTQTQQYTLKNIFKDWPVKN